MLARSEKGRSERYGDILSAAERVFTRDGFALATMDAIAQEAGVSKGGLYRHITSKEGLFLAVVARIAEELAVLLRHACEQGPQSGYSALEACVAVAVAFARERDGRFRLALESSSIRGVVEPQNAALLAFDAAVGRLVQVGLDLLRRGQEDGTIRSDIDVRALGANLWGSVVGALQFEWHMEAVALRVGAQDGARSADLVKVITSSARPSSAYAASHVRENDFGNRSAED
jgi:AcrR family transcriptional regulator